MRIMKMWISFYMSFLMRIVMVLLLMVCFSMALFLLRVSIVNAENRYDTYYRKQK